jgi:UDP-hydrolysing UDP-N-acetyl-D-glucosamine 2-epimerase
VRRIAIVTGTRAEWGILEPVCAAVSARADLSLEVCAGGAHLLASSAAGGAPTIALVERAGHRTHRFEMQRVGETGRAADAAALGRGVSAFAELLPRLAPDFVLVLGDRIEAFAAASAASVGGVRVAHVHGGDRAEGVADEAMRHAIAKLAHLHFPASAESAARLARMGEESARIHLVGSPAVDGLDAILPASDEAHAAAGAPDFVFLMHPVGRDDADEEREARAILDALAARGRVLALLPNTDPGREGIVRAIEAIASLHPARVRVAANLARADFTALLRHRAVRAIVGNSSAGLIECAALGVRAVNIGARQGGRERADNARDVATGDLAALGRELDALPSWRPSGGHPYLAGGASRRIAEALATVDLDRCGLRKRNAD